MTGTARTHPPATDAPAGDGLDVTRDKRHGALPDHVAFDGWSRPAIEAAAADAGLDRDVVRLVFPRGGVDAALAFHARGDRLMEAADREIDTSNWGITDRITRATRLRIEVIAPHREAVRRATSLFALPIHAPDGAAALWRTADALWNVIGDTSDDLNWYTKRATLSGVYSSAALYWLQDDSPDYANTWAFLDRRIANVLQIEGAKAAMRRNPFGRMFMGGFDRVFGGFRAPRGSMQRRQAPGSAPPGASPRG